MVATFQVDRDLNRITDKEKWLRPITAAIQVILEPVDMLFRCVFS